MSTYLLVLASGPFDYIESSYTSPLSGKTRPVRLYGTYFQLLLFRD
jgi:aminopeptidase 2